MNIYLSETVYADLVALVAADLLPCLWTGGLDLNGAKIALGERVDIWPISIRADAEANGHA